MLNGCSAHLSTKTQLNRVTREPTAHNHYDQDDEIHYVNVINKMKVMLTANPARGVAEIYEDVPSV